MIPLKDSVCTYISYMPILSQRRVYTCVCSKNRRVVIVKQRVFICLKRNEVYTSLQDSTIIILTTSKKERLHWVL